MILVPALAIGLARLRFDVEVLDLLPDEVPVVQGLKLYQRHFANTRELVITLDAPDGDAAETAARSLAEHLRGVPALASMVTWQPPWRERPDQGAEFLAYVWLNQSPEHIESLATSLDPRRITRTLEAARDELATSLSPGSLARLGYDPLGLGQLPGAHPDVERGLGGGDDLFASSDGRFRVIYVEAAGGTGHYRASAAWLNRVKAAVTSWRRHEPGSEAVAVRYTGQPVFMAEIGSGMEGDILRSVTGMFVVIGALFWLAHRTWRPLLQLLAILTLLLAATFALGGAVFGRLNVVSAGFAAMLLALAVDYGLVLYQESRANPDKTPADLRRILGPGIWWAALTTAMAFFATCLARFPGLVEMGLLVGTGVLLAAFAMLHLFLPWCQAAPAKSSHRSPQPGTSIPAPQESQSTPMLPESAMARWCTVIILVLALGVLQFGLPKMDRSTDALRPSTSSAYAALRDLKEHLGVRTEPAWLLIAAPTDEAMLTRLGEIDARLKSSASRGEIQSYSLPLEFWPNPHRQRLNASRLAAVAPAGDLIDRLATGAGLTTNAVALAQNVFSAWRAAAAHPDVWCPSNSVTRWALDRFSDRTGQPRYALGLLYPSEGRSFVEPWAVDLGTQPQTWLADWDALGATLLEHIRQDFKVILPCVVTLVLVALGCAFRRPLEVILGLAALGFSLVVLLAIMRAAGWSWNLMNLVALPVLLGTGVDYVIHMQLALRRHRGDLRAVRRGVGRALILCGATTLAGFGSLVLSSNAGLAALGRVCATGMAVVVLTTIVLLPSWWLRWSGSESPGREPPRRPSRWYRAEIWRVGMSLTRCLPLGLLRILARAAAALFWHLDPARRMVVLNNLQPLFPHDPPSQLLAARGLYRQFALKLLDLWRYESGRDIRDAFGGISGQEKLLAALNGGRGVLLVTPHLGNWEFGGPLLARSRIELLALTLAEPHEPLTRLRGEARARHGIQTLVIQQDPFAFLEVIRRLQDGKAVALLVDRPPAASATEVQLFGQPILVSVAPAELARASGCVILPVCLLRSTAGQYDAHVLDPVAYDRPALRDPAARRRLGQEILRAFEPLIRQHPDQWFHFVPIWPQP